MWRDGQSKRLTFCFFTTYIVYLMLDIFLSYWQTWTHLIFKTPHEVDTSIFSVLQIRKLRLRDNKGCTHSRSQSEQDSRLTPGSGTHLPTDPLHLVSNQEMFTILIILIPYSKQSPNPADFSFLWCVSLNSTFPINCHHLRKFWLPPALIHPVHHQKVNSPKMLLSA